MKDIIYYGLVILEHIAILYAIGTMLKLQRSIEKTLKEIKEKLSREP